MSRRAMLSVVHRMLDDTHSSFSSCSSSGTLPHQWKTRRVVEIRQGEGGEQGDPLMPALLALGQHALEAIQATMSSRPCRVATVEQSVEIQLWGPFESRQGSSVEQMWERPPDCERVFQKADGTPNDVWRGDPGLPSHKEGVTILGTPLSCRIR